MIMRFQQKHFLYEKNGERKESLFRFGKGIKLYCVKYILQTARKSRAQKTSFSFPPILMTHISLHYTDICGINFLCLSFTNDQ